MGELMKKGFCVFALILALGVNLEAHAIVEPNSTQDKQIHKEYGKCTKDANIIEALQLLKNTPGEFSRRAILGENLSNNPIKIEFTNLAQFNPQYANFDALGWKKGAKLYIYINQKHVNAPPQALAALLAHEAVHQDEYNSLNEETYAWTMEAAVWTHLLDDHPEIAKNTCPLVHRQNTIHKLFVKGNYTSEYIRKSVTSNLGYQNLPSRSPGFEDNL